jgi:hypothetical protein
MGGLSTITCNNLSMNCLQFQTLWPPETYIALQTEGCLLVKLDLSHISEIIHLSVFGSYRTPEVAAICASLKLLDSCLPLRTSYPIVDCNFVLQPHIYGMREHYFGSAGRSCGPKGFVIAAIQIRKLDPHSVLSIQYYLPCSIFLQ